MLHVLNVEVYILRILRILRIRMQYIYLYSEWIPGLATGTDASPATVPALVLARRHDNLRVNVLLLLIIIIIIVTVVVVVVVVVIVGNSVADGVCVGVDVHSLKKHNSDLAYLIY